MTPQDWQALLDKYGAAFWNNIAAPVWELAVRQAYVQAAQSLVAAAAFAVLSIIAYRTASVAWTKRNALLERDKAGKGEYQYSRAPSDDTDAFTVGTVLLYAVAIMAATVVVFSVQDALSRLINPNWYALQNLLGTVKR